MRPDERKYRDMTAKVIQRYYELEDGILGRERGGDATFDPRVLDYRIDVGRVIAKLGSKDRRALELIYRDGWAIALAVKAAGIETAQAYDYMDKVSISLGRLFERLGLNDLEAYLK